MATATKKKHGVSSPHQRLLEFRVIGGTREPRGIKLDGTKLSSSLSQVALCGATTTKQISRSGPKQNEPPCLLAPADILRARGRRARWRRETQRRAQEGENTHRSPARTILTMETGRESTHEARKAKGSGITTPNPRRNRKQMLPSQPSRRIVCCA